jgi:protein-L-isoaspartate(D-aspartate) O-methyltransferase
LFLSRIPDRFFRAGSTCLFLLGLWAAAPAQFSARAQAPQTLDDKFTRARRVMVERDLAARGIKDRKVLDAMGFVPRHLFVPATQVGAAYDDRPLSIGEGQTISQPYIVALMSELLELQESERLLEIGTGSGYQAAVLSRLAKEVYTIEIVPALAERAKATLARLGYRNVQIKTGDGFYGWEEKSPFEAILFTAAAEKIPEPLWRQLREEGRLVMPMGKEGQTQKLVRVKKIAGQQRIERITEVIFVPMTGEVRKEAR